MIAVIADDFTGAAEIGGVGIRNGFEVVIDTKVSDRTDADILIIATDTRSQAPADAEADIERITAGLLKLGPEFIYKKIDSILRGNVADELMAQLRVSSKERALLIPANPHLRRTIRDGIYYYKEVPLNVADFSKGTEDKAVASAHVLDLIGNTARSVTTVVSCNESLHENGLMIGNTRDASDMQEWAGKVDGRTLPAGGSGFFDAILKNLSGDRMVKSKELKLGRKIIYVCGSAFGSSTKCVKKAAESGQPVAYMPGRLFQAYSTDEALFSRWKEQILTCLDTKNKVIIAVGEVDGKDVEDLSLKIRDAMAELAGQILAETQIHELIIEGGATAFSIIQKLGYTKFYPTQELGAGTIRMRVEEEPDLHLTLKPGSYAWPETIWKY